MFKQAILDGLWKQNPGVIQLLGLCPTLAVTTTVVNGVSLGLATVFVMIFSNASIAPIRAVCTK
jgi:electron transport complex protein RnfE